MKVAPFSLFVNKIVIQFLNTQAMPLLKGRWARRKVAACVIPPWAPLLWFSRFPKGVVSFPPLVLWTFAALWVIQPRDLYPLFHIATQSKVPFHILPSLSPVANLSQKLLQHWFCIHTFISVLMSIPNPCWFLNFWISHWMTLTSLVVFLIPGSSVLSTVPGT